MVESLTKQYCFHAYNVRHQYRAYRSLKGSLEVDEAVVHLDFSETYSLKYAAEVQVCDLGASNAQATLHTGQETGTRHLQPYPTHIDTIRSGFGHIWLQYWPIWGYYIHRLNCCTFSLTDQQPSTGVHGVSLLK